MYICMSYISVLIFLLCIVYDFSECSICTLKSVFCQRCRIHNCQFSRVLIVWFKYSISLVIFCLPVLLITHRTVLKYPIIIENLSISYFTHLVFDSYISKFLYIFIKTHKLEKSTRKIREYFFKLFIY